MGIVLVLRSICVVLLHLVWLLASGSSCPRSCTCVAMSSFFSRVKAKFKGSSGEDGEDGVATASNERKEGFVLNFPTGQIAFTPAEGDVFTKLALMLDVAGDDSIGGRHGAMFLRRSGLSKDQLRDLWKLACGGKSKVCRPWTPRFTSTRAHL